MVMVVLVLGDAPRLLLELLAVLGKDAADGSLLTVLLMVPLMVAPPQARAPARPRLGGVEGGELDRVSQLEVAGDVGGVAHVLDPDGAQAALHLAAALVHEAGQAPHLAPAHHLHAPRTTSVHASACTAPPTSSYTHSLLPTLYQ